MSGPPSRGGFSRGGARVGFGGGAPSPVVRLVLLISGFFLLLVLGGVAYFAYFFARNYVLFSPCLHPVHEATLRAFASQGVRIPDYSAELASMPSAQQRAVCQSGAVWLGFATHIFQPRQAMALPPELASMLQIVDTQLASLQPFVEMTSWPPTLREPVNDCTRQRSKAFFDAFSVKFTYESTRIEGSTLSMRQTIKLARQFFWPWKCSGTACGGNNNAFESIPPEQMRHAQEAWDHLDAWTHVLQELQTVDQRLLPVGAILELHRRLTSGTLGLRAGRWRTENVYVSGSHLIAPAWEEVPAVMDQWITWMHTHADAVWQRATVSHSPVSAASVSAHPVVFAALVHLYFVTVHPFSDGNGRMARLLMNLVLIQHGYPPINIKSNPDDVGRYYRGLQRAQPQPGGQPADVVPFLRVIITEMEQELGVLAARLQNDVQLCRGWDESDTHDNQPQATHLTTETTSDATDSRID